jgi:hypothetical protein
MTNAPLDPVALIQEAFDSVKQENLTLRESVEEVRAMMDFENRGWVTMGLAAGGEHLEGLELSEVQDIAKKIAPKVVGASLPARAVNLHSGFVWGRGCYIEGTEKPKGRGRPSAARNFYVRSANQESIFSDTAREELQKARFIDGNVLVAVDPSAGTVNRIPFNQITDYRVDPDFPENVWLYKRTWNTQDGTANSQKSLWYYTKRYTGPKRDSITVGDETVAVSEQVIVDLRANRQIGYVLGVPDGLPGILWSEVYGRILNYGETVQEGLAKIIFRVTNKTKQGTQSTGVKIANFGGHGGTASMAEGQELTAVSTAGKGYDYASARPIAAMAAAAWNVSTMDLLNDSSAAGSSYGSAAALVGGNKNAMLLMQREWADFYKDIFEVANLGRPAVLFDPFEKEDPYRAMQALKLAQDGLHDEEYRMKLLDILDISGDSTDIPESLKVALATAQSAVQTAAPDQGRSNGAGGGGQGANDQRNDTISSQESLRNEMAIESIAERIENAVAKFEALQG